jgi:hypothetical protein
MSTISHLMTHVVNAGFPPDVDMVHLFIGGSQLHGAKVEGYDDLDIYGALHRASQANPGP